MSDALPTIADPAQEEVSAEEKHEITELTRQLREKHFLTYLSVLQSDVCDDRAFRALMNMLMEPNDALWKQRTLAAWIVGRAALNGKQKEYAAEVLCSVLKNPLEVKRKRLPARLSRALFRSTCIMAILGTGWAFLYVLIWTVSFPGWGDSWGFMVMLLIFSIIIGSVAGGVLGMLGSPIILPLSLAVDNSRSDRARTAAATALGRLRMPESVGALASGAVDRNPRVRQASMHALSVVLPTLTPEHYGQLETEAGPSLCRALERQAFFPNETFISKETSSLSAESLIEALEKVGDGRAVNTIQHLAEQGSTSTIRASAQRILPILQERQRQENDPKMLLRGAEQPSIPMEQMLRPATFSLTEPPEVLLRPITGSQAVNDLSADGKHA